MKQHGSLNAVLATEQEQLPVAQSRRSPSTTSPPTSPTSPTGSGAPSFSWPRRVRSPEPYVPLRKASPERLRNRRAAVPHPILVHTNAGSQTQGYAPGTSSRTAAAPYHTQVYAAPERDDEHDEHNEHNHDDQHNRDHEHNPYQATGYGRCGPPPITPTIRQARPPRQMHSVEASRKASWPLPMEEDRDSNQYRSSPNKRVASSQSHHYYHHHNPHQRGMTPSPTWHRKPGGPALKTSRSMQEGLRATSGTQDRLYKLSHESNGRLSPAPPSPSIQYPYSVLEEEEVRASFRSAMTSGSSQVASTIGTSRSSVATADSSFSEYIKVDSPASVAPSRDSQAYSSDFDVDDALDLYAAGFETPIRSSIDVSRRASVDSGRSAPFRPHPAPLGSNRLGVKADHRRSRSASHLDMSRIRAEESSQIALPLAALPRPLASNAPIVKPSSAGHIRSSTLQIVTKQLSVAPSPQPTPEPAPESTPEPTPDADVYVTPPPPPPRDRYGFKKKSHNYTPEEFEKWERGYDEHLAERRVKWEALMKKFGLSTKNPTRFPPKSDKVKKYVRKGIPPEWRGAAWFWYAGGPSKLARDPGLYRNLLKKVNEGKLSETDREHIERDLNRTFPDNDRFKPDPVTARDSHTDTSKSAVENGEKEQDMVCALRRVLQAFAVHNPNIGYCQSLNFIAGLLLIFLDADEEKAFVLLNVVTTDHLPGTHGVALEGANIDIAVLMSSIKESIPSVWSKLDDRQPTNSIIGGPPRLPTVSLATTAWFMSLFVGTLPIECVLRVWDCLFFEGSKTLFRVALAIFKLGEPAIRAINDPMEIFQEVQSMPRKMLDANALMDVCFRKRHGFGGLSQDAVEKRREERRRDVKEGRTFDEVTHSGMGSKLRKVKSKSRFKIH